MARPKKALPYWLVYGVVQLLRLLRHTWRVRIDDRAGSFTRGQPWPIIAVLWHNRIPILADFFSRQQQRETAALASASRDGEAAAHVLRAFQYQVVRGSSSRGGHGALNALLGKLTAGNSCAITVDGPRGPRYGVHAGALHLAAQSGLPVVPLVLNAPRRWELKSWDRTQFPKPFSRVTLVVGEPLYFTTPRDDAERLAQIEQLQAAMLALTDDRRG